MSRVDVMRGLTPPSSGGFLDLESVGMRAAEASAPIVPDFSGRAVETDAGPEIDPVSLEVGGMQDADAAMSPVVPAPGVAEFARGITGIPSAAFDFNMGLADSLTQFGAAAAGGLARVARQVSGGLLDLSGIASSPDERETQLLTAGDPQSVAAGERLRDQRMRSDAAGRAGFSSSIRAQRETTTPGADADSWAYFGGSSLGSVIPSFGAMANPVTAIPVMASYAAGAYESRYDDYVQKSVEQTGSFDPQKATVLGILSAGVEAALEALPIRFAAKAGQRVIDIASDAALRGSQGWRAAAAKELTTALLGSAAVEGSTEAATTLLNTLLDLTHDADLQRQVQEDPAAAMREVASRMGEAFMGGALGGVLLGGAGVASGRPSRGGPAAAPNTLSQSGGTGGQIPLFDPKATPQRFNAQSVSEALDIPFEEGHAVVALADAMGLDKSRILVQRGGSADGESLSQGGARTVGPGISRPPETAYREPVSRHTDTVYRETSIDRALDFLPGQASNLRDERVFVANTPDLALGNGANTGVLLEFDSANLEGQLNTAKPGWKAAWESGQAEYEWSYNAGKDYQAALRSVTIKPDAMADKASRDRMQRAISQLVARGWTQERLNGGGVKLSRPAVSGARTLSQGAPEKSPSVWYSKLRNVVAAKMGGAMDAKQLVAMLRSNGVREEEIDYSGLRGLTGKVTREQVAATLAENAVTVQDITKESSRNSARLDVMFDAEISAVESARADLRNAMSSNASPDEIAELEQVTREYLDLLRGDDGRPEADVGMDMLRERLDDMLNQYDMDSVEARFDRARQLQRPTEVRHGGYQTPGERKGYTELLLVLPSRENGADYTSNHWEQKNVVAHVRFNERTIDGKRTLFIEEIQSDWHQQGREKGYSSPRRESELRAEIEKAREETQNRFAEAKRFAADNPGARPSDDTEASRQWAYLVSRHADAAARLGELENQLLDAREGVPDAPFKKSWPELSLKRMIRHAAENGFEAIAWGDGASRADLFPDLAESIRSVSWKSNDDGSKSVSVVRHSDDGRYVPLRVEADGTVTETRGSLRNAHGHKASQVFGRDLAARIMGETEGNVEGDGLRIGDAGMRGFYDQIVVSEAKRLVRKYGVDVKERSIETPPQFASDENVYMPGDEIRAFGFDITPAMREDALRQGMPLFQSDKGTVTFRGDGTALIRGLAGSDVSTGIHEIAHVARRHLFDRSIPASQRAGITDTDIATAEEWAGAADGVWTVEAEEKFARGLERYIRDGKAPSKRLESLFAKLRTWMLRIYRSVAGSPIDIQISEPMRQVFDRLVSRGNVLKVPLRDVYSSAVGEGYAETRPDIPERLPRVARPEAIELLRANGLWPEGETPDDIALSLVTDARMAPVLTGILAKTKLSRSDATALFGDRGDMQKDDARAAWLNALRGLAEEQGFVPVTVTDDRILDIPPTQPRRADDPEESGVDPVFFRQGALLEFRRRVQDELIKWEKMENDVSPEEMFSAGSPTGLMRTASAAVATARLEFRERFGKFLADLSMHRITAERLYRYMMAQHAQEANQAAARRAPDNPDVAYGFTDDAAAAHLAVESRAPDFAILEEMADRARAFDAEIFEMAYDGGLITDAQYAAMSQYQKYTRTMDDPDFTASIEEEVALAERKRFSVGRKQYEKRTGRTQASLDDPTDARAKAIAENGLARMVENFERKIGRVANNRIGNAIRKWAAKNPASRGSVSVVAEPPMVDAIRDGETQRVPDPEYGNRPNVLSFRMDEDGFIGGKLVRRGETFYVEIADMPTAIAMKSATELTDGGYKLLRAILRTATNIVRVGATGAPSLTFGFARNWPRDIQSSRIVMTTHERYGVDQSIRRRWKRNLLPAMRALVAQQWRGKMPTDQRMAMRLKEWERSGGKLEFVGPADYLKAQNLVRHALDPTAKTRLAASLDSFVNFLRRVNSPMESFTKFAYFVTLRDSGIDAQKAAVLSRDLIDYGKRGASTGFLRDAKAFFNAHIQGVERQITSLGTRQGKQAQAFIMALGFAQGMMAYWLYGPDIDGTGEEDWEEETEFEKRTTVQIPAIFSDEGPTGVVKVPLDHSLVLSHAIGRALAESITGGTEVSEVFHGLANAALDNFNPFGGSGLIQSPSAAFRGFVPDAALPAFDLTTNTNYRGFPIYDTPFRGQEGGWVRADNPQDETAPAFAEIAQAIQRNTGFDMAPEIMPYMLNYLFGGGGRDVSQLVGLATAPFTEEGFSDITTSDIPIVRALARQGASRAVLSNDYYTLKAKTEKYKAQLEKAIERGDMQTAIAIAERNPELDLASREIDRAESLLRRLRESRSELRNARDAAVDSGDYETASASRAALLELKRSMREVRAAALQRVRTPPQDAGDAQAAPVEPAEPRTPVGTAP